MPLARIRDPVRIFRYAMFFDGVDDRVNVGHGESVNIVYSITVEAWVMFLRLPSLDRYSGVLGKTYFDYKGYNIQTGPNTGKLYFTIGTGSAWLSAVSNTVFNIGGFYHVVGLFDGSALRLYTNTALDGSPVPYSGTIAQDPTKDLMIGMVPDGITKFVNALIPSVRIYSRALSESEISWNYNNPNNPVRKGLALWLQAHPDNIRDIDGDGVLEWLDLSGYNNHGKIYGATLVKLIRDPVR
jgi:hypothetical protein